jgi:hypothetical protein
MIVNISIVFSIAFEGKLLSPANGQRAIVRVGGKRSRYGRASYASQTAAQLSKTAAVSGTV